MPGSFVVEAEAGPVGADRMNAAGDPDKARGFGSTRRLRPPRLHRGTQRIEGERVQQVSHHQFLVLLLVMQT